MFNQWKNNFYILTKIQMLNIYYSKHTSVKDVFFK